MYYYLADATFFDDGRREACIWIALLAVQIAGRVLSEWKTTRKAHPALAALYAVPFAIAWMTATFIYPVYRISRTNTDDRSAGAGLCRRPFLSVFALPIFVLGALAIMCYPLVYAAYRVIRYLWALWALVTIVVMCVSLSSIGKCMCGLREYASRDHITLICLSSTSFGSIRAIAYAIRLVRDVEGEDSENSTLYIAISINLLFMLFLTAYDRIYKPLRELYGIKDPIRFLFVFQFTAEFLVTALYIDIDFNLELVLMLLWGFIVRIVKDAGYFECGAPKEGQATAAKVHHYVRETYIIHLQDRVAMFCCTPLVLLMFVCEKAAGLGTPVLAKDIDSSQTGRVFSVLGVVIAVHTVSIYLGHLLLDRRMKKYAAMAIALTLGEMKEAIEMDVKAPSEVPPRESVGHKVAVGSPESPVRGNIDSSELSARATLEVSSREPSSKQVEEHESICLDHGSSDFGKSASMRHSRQRSSLMELRKMPEMSIGNFHMGKARADRYAQKELVEVANELLKDNYWLYLITCLASVLTLPLFFSAV